MSGMWTRKLPKDPAFALLGWLLVSSCECNSCYWNIAMQQNSMWRNSEEIPQRTTSYASQRWCSSNGRAGRSGSRSNYLHLYCSRRITQQKIGICNSILAVTQASVPPTAEPTRRICRFTYTPSLKLVVVTLIPVGKEAEATVHQTVR